MSDQPEALRLADWLDALDVRKPATIQECVNSAALLRSQHARIAELEAERDALKAKAELYEWLLTKSGTIKVGEPGSDCYEHFCIYGEFNGSLTESINIARNKGATS